MQFLSSTAPKWNARLILILTDVFLKFLFQGQITLMDVPVFKAIQPEVSILLALFSSINEKVMSVYKFWNCKVHVYKS